MSRNHFLINTPSHLPGNFNDVFGQIMELTSILELITIGAIRSDGILLLEVDPDFLKAEVFVLLGLPKLIFQIKMFLVPYVCVLL